MLFAVWWAVGSVMLTAQMGWWFNGVGGLAPAAAQLQVLRMLAQGTATRVVSALAIARRDHPETLFRIEVPRADVANGSPAEWRGLEDVPAGLYSLDVSTRRPTGGTLAVRIGRPPAGAAGRPPSPLRSFALRSLSDQSRELWLPAGARSLRFEPDAALASFGRTVELVPRSLVARAGATARAAAAYGSADCYFLDDNVFVEGDGFWVRGGQAADVVIAAPGGRRILDDRTH